MGNTTTNIPAWADAFIEKVLTHLDEGGVAMLPKVTWRRTSSNWSSGRAWPAECRIHVSAGTCRKDAKLIILHEIAHLMFPADEHHSDEFWEAAFKMYRQFGIPSKYAVEREAHYKANAVPVAKKLGYRIPKKLHHKLKTRTARRIKRQEAFV